ncbi:unnamed protein product [Rhizoctonia solani]|uniref:Uncharacterized protein n=1 Tax=Rhizoctonia solani TaxID=456999 RepID=A0A8H3HJ67_9AGAM|nr:unnamed protein product [Rhizoctonia solani]
MNAPHQLAPTIFSPHGTGVMQSNDLLNGFPAGYFLIKAVNSSHHGRDMLLDVSRSERQPGVELVLWADETQSLWPFGDDWNDHQVFFMCKDGALRSKATGHPIGCKYDAEADTLKLVAQSPRPFNHRPQPRCRFTYDSQSKNIRMHQPDKNTADQICGLTRWDTGDSGVCVSVTFEDSASSEDVDPHHILEFVPRGHRHRRLSQVLNGALELPRQELRSRKLSNSIAPERSSQFSVEVEDADADDSWHRGREVRMVRWRGSTTRFQEWDIIPLGSPACEKSDDEWSVVD